MSKDASGNYHQRLMRWTFRPRGVARQPVGNSGHLPGTGYGSSNGMQVFDPGQYPERVGLLLMNRQITWPGLRIAMMISTLVGSWPTARLPCNRSAF